MSGPAPNTAPQLGDGEVNAGTASTNGGSTAPRRAAASLGGEAGPPPSPDARGVGDLRPPSASQPATGMGQLPQPFTQRGADARHDSVSSQPDTEPASPQVASLALPPADHAAGSAESGVAAGAEAAVDTAAGPGAAGATGTMHRHHQPTRLSHMSYPDLSPEPRGAASRARSHSASSAANAHGPSLSGVAELPPLLGVQHSLGAQTSAGDIGGFVPHHSGPASPTTFVRREEPGLMTSPSSGDGAGVSTPADSLERSQAHHKRPPLLEPLPAFLPHPPATALTDLLPASRLPQSQPPLPPTRSRAGSPSQSQLQHVLLTAAPKQPDEIVQPPHVPDGAGNGYAPPPIPAASAGNTASRKSLGANITEEQKEALAAEVKQLESSADFLAERAEDPKFMLLHFIALLGTRTLDKAKQLCTTDVLDRYAALARYVIEYEHARPFVEDQYGCTPLAIAAALGNVNMVHALIEPYGISAYSKAVLPRKSVSGDRRVSRQRPSRSGDDSEEDVYDYLNHQDSQIRWTALHSAVNHSRDDVVVALLEYGANPQALDVTRKTAFKVSQNLHSLQRLLRIVVDKEARVPMAVIVQLMAEVLEQEKAEGVAAARPGAAPGEVGAGGTASAPAAPSAAAAREPTPMSPAGTRQPLQKLQRGASRATRNWNAGKDAILHKQSRFTMVADQVVEQLHEVDVGTTITGFFESLHAAASPRHDTIAKYVETAIRCNHYKLTETMLKVILKNWVDVIQSREWEEVLAPLVSTFPSLFQFLLLELRSMKDEDIRGYVRSLHPDGFQRAKSINAGSGPAADGPIKPTAKHIQPDAAGRVSAAGPAPQRGQGSSGGTPRMDHRHRASSTSSTSGDTEARGGGAADHVKLLIYKHLVEGLQEVGKSGGGYRVIKIFFEDMDEHLLNDMAQFPVFADFCRLIADQQAAQALDESDSTRRLLLDLLRKPEQKKKAPPPQHTPAAMIGRMSGRLTAKVAPVSVEAGDDGGGNDSAEHARPPPPRATISRFLMKLPELTPVTSIGRDKKSKPGSHNKPLELQMLNVGHVLHAAISAGKSHNVEAAVANIVSWVDANTKEKKGGQVFLTGITAELIKNLASRFPSSCATLLNVVSREVMENLDTLQVPAALLNGKDHLVKCSHERNHFTWRTSELQRVKKVKGFTEAVVDALVDYGLPFECVYKAAVELGASAEDVASLIEAGITGPDLKVLISNGIRLEKIRSFIEACAKPLPEGFSEKAAKLKSTPAAELLRDMLQEKLSPRIVDTILDEGPMFETTRYNNFRPGRPLQAIFPESLFVPKYTAHFVHMLLAMWRNGEKNAKGEWTAKPWDKKFIDSVFESNDPLYTKLKGMFDSKLTDTQVYIQTVSPVPTDGNSSADGQPAPASAKAAEQVKLVLEEAHEQHEVARRQYERVGRMLGLYIRCGRLLVHRWPVWLAAWLSLIAFNLVSRAYLHVKKEYHLRKARSGALVRRGVNESRTRTFDAAVLSFPILGFVKLTKDQDILTALAEADAPAHWYNCAVVRALYTLHWSMFGRVLMYLHASAHLLYALIFMAFFLIVVNMGRGSIDAGDPALEEAAGSGGDPAAPAVPLRELPPVLATSIVSVVFSGSMVVERILERNVPTLGTWVAFGRHLELLCHAMVWAVAAIVWSGEAAPLVPALSGLAMLVFVGRLSLFGLVTDKLATAALALLEIISDSGYFFLLIALVYGGFVLAVTGFRSAEGWQASTYPASLFTALVGDFQADQLTDDKQIWHFHTIAALLLSAYAVLMMIVFINLLIATMNDTYDRVKEFTEVEVMRLRAHMMVYLKDALSRAGWAQKADGTGEVLHLLLRPEEVKSGRWVAQGGTGQEPSNEWSAWAGRITYMRSSIVREVERVVQQNTDRSQMDILSALDARLQRIEAVAVAAAAAAASARGDAGGSGGGGGDDGGAGGPAAGAGSDAASVPGGTQPPA